MTTVEIVCAVTKCRRPALTTSLCQHHQNILERDIPEQLEKWGAWPAVGPRLTDDELAVIAARVELDALPLTIIALQWCMTEKLRKTVPPAILAALSSRLAS